MRRLPTFDLSLKNLKPKKKKKKKKKENITHTFHEMLAVLYTIGCAWSADSISLTCCQTYTIYH